MLSDGVQSRSLPTTSSMTDPQDRYKDYGPYVGKTDPQDRYKDYGPYVGKTMGPMWVRLWALCVSLIKNIISLLLSLYSIQKKRQIQ